MRTGRGQGRQAMEGFTLVWVLMFMAVIGIGLAVVGPVWQQSVKRDREQAMIRNALQYVNAIEDYYRASPGSTHQFPAEVAQLLQDTRFVGTVRHLRKLYSDPVNRGAPFAYIRDMDGRIVGVASTSKDVPIIKSAWSDGVHLLSPANHYDEWKFIAVVSTE